MRQREADAVDQVLNAVCTVAPELAPERLREIAMSIRREMGGRRYYVRRNERADARDEADVSSTALERIAQRPFYAVSARA